jgi:4-alpha-glucanotransferase
VKRGERRSALASARMLRMDTAARVAGVLLHPTSLPGVHGCGDLGPAADGFLEWCEAAGQTLWQVLPLGPTGYGNSPYGALSAFAGNPLLISPEELLTDGLLPRPALQARPRFAPGRVEFEPARAWKEKLLRASFEHFRDHAPARLRREAASFEAASEQEYWLADWTLFIALKGKHGGSEWTAWPAALRDREPKALAAARKELADEIAYHAYAQFLFHRQWRRLREVAVDRGVRILGDLPIYTAADSADVWAHRDLFRLDAEGRANAVSGVPPDYFSPDGQRWGNPLYDWERLAATDFAWWVERVRANLRLADAVRLDHFRGFAAFWEIPAAAETAKSGRWVRGPGAALFEALRAALGPRLPLVAEDLGLITPDVEALRQRFHLPGMKVLQFGFGEVDSANAPHRHSPQSIVYTGTHDNDTTAGWFAQVGEEERQRLEEYLGRGEPMHLRLLRAAYGSVAAAAIVPIQDLLGLGSEARMNTPGNPSANWTWRARKEDFSPELAAALRKLAEATARVPMEEKEPVELPYHFKESDTP